MNGKTLGSRFALWAVTAVSLWCCAEFVRAEVGVTDTGPVEHMYEARIIEDSDPVGASWRPSPITHPKRHALNTGGETNGDGLPSLLYNSVSRLPIVAWSKKTPSGFDVVVSRYDNDAWTAPQVLAAGVTVTEDGRPQLLLNPTDGSVHLLYWENEAAPRVMHRQAPADLSSWSVPAQVSAPTELAKRPAGVFHDGLLHVVYESHGPGQFGLPRLMVIATHDGSSFSTEVLAVSSYDQPNRIEVHSASGKLWVDWIDGDGEMCWRRRQSPGLWEPTQLETFSGIEQRDFHVRGAIKNQAID